MALELPVDNRPAHRGKPLMDGLRFGSSPPAKDPR